MIEKLDKKMEFVEISILGNKKAECLDFEAGRRLNLKINELVDAVNELQLSIKPILEERESGIKVYEEAQNMYDNAILDALKDKQVDVVVEPADPYAEQHKWVGKLCRFRDNPACEWKYGILYKIYEDTDFPFWDTDCNEYAECEPVKPDEDIIYKGGDNE